jgi:predicted CXXCH cytochrome family protein
MKRLVLAAAILFAGSAFAATAPKEPKVIEAKQGNITFKHDTHAAQKCEVCHGAGEPKALKLDKEAGHKLCQGCHKEQKKGPQKCAECHVKK